MKQRISSYPKSVLLNGRRKTHVYAQIIVPRKTNEHINLH